MEAKWRPPTGLIVKINFDGAFEKKSSRPCSGIVARNAHVEFKHTNKVCMEEPTYVYGGVIYFAVQRIEVERA
ncbi:hypothetical protein Goari_009977 [Gossypium aridum]|uniref:Uncharacterized protein n=1 Tax=Gossypium aridum TaxID=34290 RepID=A0A7J8XYK1_GOSAI|nr:hypothetical protein [Gossypium aridum]